MNDPCDILGVCSNCGQWRRKSNCGDCLNECTRRGFEPSQTDQARDEAQDMRATGADREQADRGLDLDPDSSRRAL